MVITAMIVFKACLIPLLLIDCLVPNNQVKYQHKGLGRGLLAEAERICREEYGLKKISVISAVGTRDYYRKFGYTNNGPYVTKLL